MPREWSDVQHNMICEYHAHICETTNPIEAYRYWFSSCWESTHEALQVHCVERTSVATSEIMLQSEVLCRQIWVQHLHRHGRLWDQLCLDLEKFSWCNGAALRVAGLFSLSSPLRPPRKNALLHPLYIYILIYIYIINIYIYVYVYLYIYVY